MRVLNYSDGIIGLLYTDDPTYSRIEHGWTKEEFTAATGIDLTPYDRVTMQPDQGFYHVVDAGSSEIQSYTGISQHPILVAFAGIWDAALRVATDEHIRSHVDQYYGLSLVEKRDKALVQAQQDTEIYINDSYPILHQVLMHSLYLDPNTSAEDKAEIRAMGAWIKSVVAYYFSVRQALNDATDAATLEAAMAWDFTQFDATNPNTNLRGLV